MPVHVGCGPVRAALSAWELACHALLTGPCVSRQRVSVAVEHRLLIPCGSFGHGLPGRPSDFQKDFRVTPSKDATALPSNRPAGVAFGTDPASRLHERLISTAWLEAVSPRPGISCPPLLRINCSRTGRSGGTDDLADFIRSHGSQRGLRRLA